MQKFKVYKLFLSIIFFFFTLNAYAWENSIALGYGYSHDPNHTKYYNSGFLLSGDIYPFRQTLYTYWSLNGAIGQWHSTAPHNKNLTTGAIALALRLYPFTVVKEYPAYLLLSAGPAVLSHRQFGANKQGSNFTFQLNGGFGVEIKQKFDVNLRMLHYSNAHLAKPDQGFNILYLLSFGYLF